MFILIFIFLLIFRSNSTLLSFENLNPDEAQMIANAINLFYKNFNILEFDGTTSGILNSLILIWPKILNLEITYLTARLTSIFLISLIIFFVFKILYLQTKKTKISLFLLLPTLIFFLFTKDPDFVHYSSELLSIFFLIFSYWLIKTNQNNSKFSISIIASFVLGLVYLSKVQLFPVAAIIFFLHFYELFLKKKIKFLIISCLTFLLPIFSFFFISLVSGNLDDLIFNNFLFIYDFISSQQSEKLLSAATGSEITKENYKFMKSTFIGHLTQNLMFHTLYVYFFLFVLIILKFFLQKKFNFFSKDIIKTSLIIFSIIIITLLPGKLHRHYFLSLLPFIPIFLSEIISVSEKNKIKIYNSFTKFFCGILISFLITSSFLENKKFYAKTLRHENFEFKNIHFKSPKIFDLLFGDKDPGSLYVWGWQPQWYALSYLTSASRETIAEKQIFIKRGDYYRDRLLKDINKNAPDLIIDDVREQIGKKLFRFIYNKPNTDPDKDFESFEKLKNFVDKDYIRLKRGKVWKCPDYYLKQDLFDRLSKNLIQYKISDDYNGRLNKIDDFSFTEDVCDDAVNLGNYKSEIIDIKFMKYSKVSKIMILASKENIKEVTVNYSFIFNNKKVKEGAIILKKYPFWSEITFDELIEASEVKLNITNLKKANFGINELKIFN